MKSEQEHAETSGESMETGRSGGRRKRKGQATEGLPGEESRTMRVFSAVYDALLSEIMSRLATAGVEAP